MAMTLPEVAMYFEYAGEHPPVSWMVAGYLGIKPKPKPQSVNEQMGDLLTLFGGPGEIK